MQVHWKKSTYSSMYEVSDQGDVRRVGSIDTLIPYNPVGYDYLTIYTAPDRRKMIAVHRIVGEAFLGKKPKHLVTNHKNRIKTDNRLSNLEYITYKENAVRGVMKSKEERAKRDRKIARLLEGGASIREISIRLDLNWSHAQRMVHRILRDKATGLKSGSERAAA